MFMIKILLSRGLVIMVAVLMLVACSSGDDDPAPETALESFTVELSLEAVSFEPGNSQQIDYTLNLAGDFNVSISVETAPESGSVDLDIANNNFTYSATEEGSGSFTILFRSTNVQISKQIVYQVQSPEPDPDPDPDPDKPVIDNDQDYIIYLPSDYMTIYEDETVTFDIKRNYEMHEQIIEEFYFNTDNIDGSLSEDKSQITITALDSEEDTYGEITAVTNVNGIINESKMYLIYYNKNRDLTTPEPPVVALLEHEIKIAPYATTVKFFDIYDPDSDRISLRVLSSPTFTKSHITRVKDGYELSIHAIDEIDPNNNDLVLEVSDAHHTDVHTFNLVEDSSIINPENKPPVLSIEENVTVSLIRQFDGSETGQVAELAFVASDPDGDQIKLSAKASSDRYTFNIQPPYLYVSAEDMSDLQYEQITLVASDGQYDSQLTFHFYVKDNYLTFLGGNPNIAPMTDLPTELSLLESKTYEIPYDSYDFENHPFDVGIVQDSVFVETMLTDTHLVFTASEPEVTTQSSITIWLEDIFESRREHTIAFNIYKNTPPTLAIDFVETDEVDEAPYAIAEVEQTEVEVTVTVTDPDEPELQPVFDFDDAFLTVDYSDGVATINSLDLDADYEGQIRITATDEFGELVEEIIDVNYQFRDPNNEFPVITIEQEIFELLPGQSNETTVSIADPEDDPLVISSHKDSDDLTYTYDMNTGLVQFSVAEGAAFEQQMNITISASDGFGLSQKNIVINIPKSPAAPVLEVDFYEENVPEEDTFIITFSATDVNSEAITMSTQIAAGTDLTVNLVITDDTEGDIEGYLEITPVDNVLSPQDYSFLLVATDASDLLDSETIRFTVQPVNDPPALEYVVQEGLSPGDLGEIILSNDSFTNLNYSIEDPDTQGQDVRVIYDVKSRDDDPGTDFNEAFEFYIEYFVTASSNNIRVNGNSKDGMYGYVSANKGSPAVDGDTVNDTIIVQVQEDIGDGSASQHGDEMEVDVTLRFNNGTPYFDSDLSIDYLQLFANETYDLTLGLFDDDIDPNTRDELTDDDEQFCLTVTESSDFIELYDTRGLVEEPLALGRAHCDSDPDGPLTIIRIKTLPGFTEANHFFTVNATDGYENAAKQFKIELK